MIPSMGVGAVAVDRSGQRVALTVWYPLPGFLVASRREAHQYTIISWYAVWDTLSRQCVLQGPHSVRLAQRVRDWVVGWSDNRLVVVRRSLLEPGARYPEKGLAELSEITVERVEIVLTAPDGKEHRVRSFVCPQILGQPMPSRADAGYLEGFHLCGKGDHLLFAEIRLSFREEEIELDGGRKIRSLAVVQDRSKTVIHSLHLVDGRFQVIAELPVSVPGR